jgi:hypothetical protein
MANISAPSITLRATKGSPLTNTEVDANFTNISNALQTGLTAASYTAADVLAKLITVDGSGSGLDADLLDGYTQDTANTVSTIVRRDASGNFAANNITAATFTGTFSGTAAITSGSITLTTSLAIGSGGTGATTAAGARSTLGLVIGTDVQAYDKELAALASVTSAADKVPYFTGDGTAAVAAYTAYGRTLTGLADAAAGRTALALVIGTDVQGYSANLTALSGLTATTDKGLYTRTGAGTAVVRSIAGTTSRIVVTNGDAVAGNPTIDLGADVPSLSANNTFAGTCTFNGATTTLKAVVADTFTQASDARLKQNIQTINNAVGVVNGLRGVSYTRDGKEEIGLIAQEVELILPQVVSTTESGMKGISYSNMVGLLVEAIKEQQKTIDELNARLIKLEN